MLFQEPMAAKLFYKLQAIKKYYLLCFFILSACNLFSQKSKVDSLSKLLSVEKTDSNRVRLMWQIARDVSVYNPDTSLKIALQALFLARKIEYEEGESRSLGILANTFIKIGNYPRALELNIQKLQLEEKRKKPRNYGSVLMNIGVVYVLQEEYLKAREYFSKADTVILENNLEDLKYYSAINIGDVYNRLNTADSAFKYFNKSLELGKVFKDESLRTDLVGSSMTGLGHVYLKLGNYEQSLLNYKTGINYLTDANDDEVLCEATLGLANLYEHLNQFDSAGHYANLSLSIAKKDGFLSKELDAAEFLTDHYKKVKSIDSAFSYVTYVRELNDSVNSKSKIRESQVISSNEQFRQIELEENKLKERHERVQQLQMLLIAIFIPGFFLLTLFLSRIKVHIKLIRLLGILSLLFLFEYLTLLLHPTVANLTHHTPVYEIIIFVAMAAILIPLHHRLEHWLINKLLHHRHPKPLIETTEAVE